MLLILFLGSCAHYKNIPYFQNADTYDGKGKEFLYDMTIKPKDELTVFVFSGTDEEAVAPFNMRDFRSIDTQSKEISVRGGHPIHRYLVDNEGNIDFPVLGKIHVAGFTINQKIIYTN